MKKFLALILALALCLGLAPLAALAAETTQPTGWTVTEVVPCKYDGAWSFYEGLAEVKRDGKWGIVDQTGAEVVPCKYDMALAISEGLVLVLQNGKMGYVDQTGTEVIPCKYDEARVFSEGLAVVKLDGRYSYIDQTGAEVISCNYDAAGGFSSEGLAAVKLDGKWGFIDKTGTEVAPCKYDEANHYVEGFAMVKLDGKYGFIDETGVEVVPCKYDDAWWIFNEGLTMVELDGRCGYVDQAGVEVIPCQYDDVNAFSEGLGAVELDGKWGYVDQTGAVVIPCMYDYPGFFTEGLAVVGLDGKRGYIDKTGAEVIPCKYDSAGDFFEGLALVALDGKYGFIDETGVEVVPCKYDYARCFSEGLAAVELDGKWGYIDQTGAEVVPCKYDYTEYFFEGFATVRLDGKWGYVSALNTALSAEPAKVITSGLTQWWDLTTQGADHFVATDFAADCAYFLNDAPSGVNDVKTAAAKRGTVVEVYTNASGEISAVKAYEYTAAMVDGEVMLVCKLDTGDGTYRYTQEKAERITGKVSTFSTGGELTINGVRYEASQQTVEEDVSEFRVSKELFSTWIWRGGSMINEYNFYLDKNGSIIAIVSLNPSMELNRVCMVVGSWLENSNGLIAELLFLDGTTERGAVTKLDGQSVVAQPQTADQIAVADARQALGAPKTKFFRYHATSDGYELTELNAAEASGDWEDPVSVGDGSTTVATIVKESRFAKAPGSTSDLAGWNITVDDSTLFITCRRFASNDLIYEVYRDFRNVPEMDVTRMTAICADTSDGPDTVARLVYLERPEYQQTPGDVDPDPYTAGYVFITSNALAVDPALYQDGVYQAHIVDVDGNLTSMRITSALADAIGADPMVITQSRGYVGHFFSVGEISAKGVVSSLTNGATPPAARAVALDDVVAMGGGSITLSGSAYQYDAKTRFIYVDMGWTDGGQGDNQLNVLEPNKDDIDFKAADNFDPEGFFDPRDVASDKVYTSVRAAVIPSAADKTLADSVYVLRTLDIPADALSIPDVTPSASPSAKPSTKPGGGGSLGGGGGLTQPSTPVESPKPTESEKPAQSEKPVETEKPATPASQVFQDVARGAWYEHGVTFVVDKGLFQGVAQNAFAPHEVMTRAMLMTVLARLDGQDTAGGETWFQKGMDWAVDQAISDGTQPEASVTREQMVTMLYRYAKPAAGSGDLTAFSDAESVSDWAQAATQWAVSQGILTGKDGNRLDPQGTATRAEVATILQRFVALKK